MKTIILFISVILVCINVFAQTESTPLQPQKAAINPDFIINIATQKNTYSVIAPPAKSFFENVNQPN